MPLLGVVFDFDGVIADTEGLHLRAYQETLSEKGISLSKSEYFEHYLGYDDVGVVTAVGRDQGVVLEESEIARLIEAKGRRFEWLVGTDQLLFPGSAECIQRLASQTRLAIASGALHNEIERILTAASLRQYFEVIVAADDVERPKPAPDGYLRAVSHLAQDHTAAAPNDYVAIEDSQWGLVAARAAGLKTIGITTTYPGSSLTDADVVVDSLDEVDRQLLSALCP